MILNSLRPLSQPATQQIPSAYAGRTQELCRLCPFIESGTYALCTMEGVLRSGLKHDGLVKPRCSSATRQDFRILPRASDTNRPRQIPGNLEGDTKSNRSIRGVLAKNRDDRRSTNRRELNVRVRCWRSTKAARCRFKSSVNEPIDRLIDASSRHSVRRLVSLSATNLRLCL